MIQFTLLSLILCMGLQYAAGNPVTDTSSRKAGTWLRLHTEPATYWDAHDNCQREGGVLASPTTDELVQVMRAKMADHKSSSVFAGIASQAKGDRSLASFSNASLQWAADEPSNAADEQCLALTGAGALADVSCAHALPYFCASSVTPLSSPLTARSLLCGEGYHWEPSTGSCYKFHQTALSFRLALAKCHSEGALLAIINNAVESNALKTLFEKHPPRQIIGAEDPNYALVGFRKYEDNVWATLYGDTLAEAGFSSWTGGAPSEEGKCGSIFRDGMLNNILCTKKYAFICEMSP